MSQRTTGDPPLLSSSAPPPPRDPGERIDWMSILRNRFILAGLAMLVLLLLIAIILFAVGGDDDDASNAAAGVEPTPGAETTPVLGPGLAGVMRATATMRNGPGSTYAILGTIPRDTVVTVVGRNEDETWFQVIYPPGSQLRGWVQASLIDVEGDTSELVIAGPGESPDVIVPTFSGPAVIPTEPGGTELEEPTAVVTPTSRPTNTPNPTWTPRPTATPAGPVATPGSQKPEPTP